MKRSNPFQHLAVLPPEVSRVEIDSFLNELPVLASTFTPPWWQKRGWWQLSLPVTVVIIVIVLSTNIPDSATPDQLLIDSPKGRQLEKLINTPSSTHLSLDDTVESSNRRIELTVDKSIYPEIILLPEKEKQPELELPKEEQLLLSTRHTAPIINVLEQDTFYNQDYEPSLSISTHQMNYENQADEDWYERLNLAKLRRTLRKQLFRDGLIQTKRDSIDLWLQEEIIYLNKEELMPDLQLNYRQLAEDYKVGFGPERHIMINDRGIAVGDFTPLGFRGIARGTFRLDFLGTITPDSTLLQH